ncbi:hypothetical protein GCM10011611_31410 [Aliidongia dinghuensis]|uniref:Uncharacterized protein n=1 Tax=Aliidongia dinghuensis TaxID=1867774 RepID=A0A8J2YVT7_9PROT|nr:hypothetical protein [Aliidongia dinghuensis]GGF23031.1 hypothetical protein GCM10011611_31410 [Aliidongia dinghuensis]
MNQGGEAPGRRVATGFALLLVLALLPLASVRVPPLLDYPNHLARMHILLDAGRSDLLARAYEIRWSLLPNLAMDAVVPLLARVMPLDLAGRCFVGLALALMAAGAVLVDRAVRRSWSLWPLAAFLLLYNRILLWGFVNYLAGLGVALIGLALWIGLADRPGRRLRAVAVAALAAYFCHVVAFGLLALMIGGVELGALWSAVRGRRWSDLMRLTAAIAAPLVPPVALWLAAWRPGPGDGGGLAWANPLRKIDLLYSVFDNYSRPFDVAGFVVLVLLVGFGFWRGRLTLDRRLGAALAVLTAVYLVMPARMLGGSGVDHRLPVMLGLLLIAATRPVGWSRRGALVVGGAVLALFIVRTAVVEAAWLGADRIYRPILAALERLPRGSRLAVAGGPSAVGAGAAPLLHLPTYAVIAVDAFVPTEFTYAGQQPLGLTPAFAALADAAEPEDLWTGLVAAAPEKRAAALAALDRYDALAVIDRRPVPPLTLPCLRPLYEMPQFRLYAIDHAAACGP